MQMIMMAFITRCLKNKRFDRRAWLMAMALPGLAALATAQPNPPEAPLLKLERLDESLWLSAQLDLELPAAVEDALLKGIPIYFVAQADLLRQRWYWMNKRIASVQRSMRLSYHPLTRRWRLNTGSGEAFDAVPGLALNQNLESLDEALALIGRISRWKIANLADLEHGIKHVIHFQFQLDVTQLPRPLQIGTLGQSDWLLSRSATQTFEPESIK
jgi:hypothetical protein